MMTGFSQNAVGVGTEFLGLDFFSKSGVGMRNGFGNTLESGSTRSARRLENKRQIEGLSDEYGYCYLSMIASPYKLKVREQIGPAPVLSSIFSIPADYFDLVALQNLELVRLSMSLYHMRKKSDGNALPILRATMTRFQKMVPPALAEKFTITAGFSADTIPLYAVIGGSVGATVGGSLSTTLKTRESVDLVARNVKSSEICVHPTVPCDVAVAYGMTTKSDVQKSIIFASMEADVDYQGLIVVRSKNQIDIARACYPSARVQALADVVGTRPVIVLRLFSLQDQWSDCEIRVALTRHTQALVIVAPNRTHSLLGRLKDMNLDGKFCGRDEIKQLLSVKQSVLQRASSSMLGGSSVVNTAFVPVAELDSQQREHVETVVQLEWKKQHEVADVVARATVIASVPPDDAVQVRVDSGRGGEFVSVAFPKYTVLMLDKGQVLHYGQAAVNLDVDALVIVPPDKSVQLRTGVRLFATDAKIFDLWDYYPLRHNICGDFVSNTDSKLFIGLVGFDTGQYEDVSHLLSARFGLVGNRMDIKGFDNCGIIEKCEDGWCGEHVMLGRCVRQLRCEDWPM